MYTSRIRVRYGETDQMGVVYHANYFQYFEIGRTDAIREHGYTYAGLERDGVRLPVVEASARFLRPALYDDLILVTTTIVEVTAVRVRFEYRVEKEDDGSLLAEGHTVLASVTAEGRPRRLPPDVQRALRAAAESAS